MTERTVIEKAMLGLMIIDPDCIDEIATMLIDYEWGCESHKLIFDATRKVWQTQGPDIDVVMIRDELVSHGLLKKAGGAETLLQRIRDVPANMPPARECAQLLIDERN